MKFTLEVHSLEILEGPQDEETINVSLVHCGNSNLAVLQWLQNPAEEARAFVLGSPFAFQAAFNATLPMATPESVESTTIDSVYSLTQSSHARAQRLLAAGGKMPDLLKRGGGSSGSKKKKAGTKKRKRR